ncbi:pyridoxal-phosphate dependent enzyme [Myxococcota bacterium]|nr:pyridoxal-phosphate dependent enzyme [Myxococcota bacterium]MBU1429881.1 pyridoxal-phosphate dependent enzyme [Myxococcota bacterium]MBU1897386.1 pyridoxal-phosphate dependent enzyme [Myxococcota bacterium]
MMKGAHADVTAAIGNTPIVRLNQLSRGLTAQIYCKLGYLNPGGSIKDRVALNIVEEAERSGALKPGGTIIEGTSGNTGMGLAMVAATRGYKTVFVMPDKQSQEKVKALRAAGAQVVITPTEVAPDDPRSYYSVAARLVKETPNAFYANQYHNGANPEAHYRSTGPEIWTQTGGEIDVLVCGLGTGGTITGAGRYLKEQKPEIKLVGIDVVGSVYYDFWKTGQIIEPHSYLVEGIGEDFFPSTIDLSLIDEIIQLDDKTCFDYTRKLSRFEGIYAGGSSGAAVAGAIRYAEKLDKPLNIVVLLPDSSVRYLNKIFDDDWMREHGFLDPEEGLGTIRDLLGNKPFVVHKVKREDTLREVISLMKREGISQVPVMERGHLLGIVTESNLLQKIFEDGEGGLDAAVSSVISDAYEVVDPDAPVGLFNHIFSQGKVIIVWERGEVRGLVTKIDVIDYLAHRGRS